MIDLRDDAQAKFPGGRMPSTYITNISNQLAHGDGENPSFIIPFYAFEEQPATIKEVIKFLKLGGIDIYIFHIFFDDGKTKPDYDVSKAWDQLHPLFEALAGNQVELLKFTGTTSLNE
mmetsp:Transcript_8814/g.7788  ORF Transcript_8814/g.7788 Transcript_8814/m.7788 type:complete len:118 (+) Transcript_8814:708-1061(+)